MKKILNKTIITLMALLFYSATFAQNYGSWVVPFEGYPSNIAWQLQFDQNQIQSTSLRDDFPISSTFRYTAGGYDQDGNLLFYIVDKQVFEANTNTVIGDFHDYDEYHLRPEVEIIRKPGSIDSYYIIFGAYVPGDNGPEDFGAFYFSEVFVDEATGAVSIGNVMQDIVEPVLWGYGGIAISKTNSSERALYRCSNVGITKIVIDNNGFANNAIEILNKYDPVVGSNLNFIAWNFEMLEKANGDIVFAWSTMYPSAGDKDKVFIYDMGADDVQKIDIDPNTTGEIGGIEFSNIEDNILYVSYNSDGSGSGLIKLDYSNGSTEMVTGGSNFSHTFLQHAPDGHIYGVSDNGLYLGMLDDVADDSFDPQYFSNYAVLSFIDRSGTFYYILPENDKVILNLEITSVNIACEGNTDGEATATTFGGFEPYTYQWTNNAGDPIGTLPTITGLGQGLYTCCITDSDSPPVEVCVTIQISVDNSLLEFDEDWFHTQNPVTTWQTNLNRSFRYGIHVHAGHTLIVSNGSYLEFGEDATIIVEPGATLQIESSTLSYFAECPFRWQGIQVWGDYNHTQLDYLQQYQGKLLLNNTTIEHATIAVDLTKPGVWLTNNGGIVQADNSVFSNNQRALHTMKYENTHPITEQPMDNLSYFKYCGFTVDNNYIGDVTFSKHADMVKTDGIKFKACNFGIGSGTPNVSSFTIAISAYSAGFDLLGVCQSPGQPCSDWEPSNVTDFYQGVRATTDGTNTYTFSVENAEFNDNATGVYASNINYLSVLFSNFNIGENAADEEECGEEGEGSTASGYGIDLNQCTGFAIEENYFSKAAGAPAGNYTGIRCKDSQTQYDLIYRNTFDGLSYGNLAEGMNRSDPGVDSYGLEFQCNTNTGNSVDFIVTTDDPLVNPQIRTHQGTMEMEAGNTFSTGVQAEGHFKNTGTQVVNYFYNTNPPTEYTPTFVVPIDDAGENTCPSHYGGSGGGSGKGLVLSPEEKLQAEQDFANNLTDFNNVKTLYDNLKDGGNTEALQAEVEMSWPQDMWELRAELLGKSPHLSKEVLMKAADKTDVLPESVLFEILSANPDELRKEELISYLENKEQPLPEYMITILRQLAGGITYKTILIQEMARYNAAKTIAAYDLIRSCLNDTVTDYIYLRNWLDNLNNINADIQIVSTYLAEGDYSSAQVMLDMIPGLYELEGNVLTEYNDYKSLTEMQVALQQQGRTTFELDSAEVATLVDYADNTSGKAAAMAKGILEFAYGYNYCNCLPVYDNSAWKSVPVMPLSKTADNGLFVEATPNPAKTWVAFDYKLPVYANEAVLQVTDIKGNTVTVFTLTSKQGQQVWDIRDIEKGVYLYTLKIGTLSKSGKLIVK